MDATAIALIIGGIVTVIGTLTTSILAIITAVKAKDDVKEVLATTTAGLSELKVETGVIKTSVDGAASAAAAEIKSLHNEIRLLRESAQDKKTIAEALATSVASGPGIPVSQEPIPVEVVNTPLKIETEDGKQKKR